MSQVYLTLNYIVKLLCKNDIFLLKNMPHTIYILNIYIWIISNQLFPNFFRSNFTSMYKWLYFCQKGVLQCIYITRKLNPPPPPSSFFSRCQLCSCQTFFYYFPFNWIMIARFHQLPLVTSNQSFGVLIIETPLTTTKARGIRRCLQWWSIFENL